MSNSPQPPIDIQRLQETKGDQEERILPDSDQEDFQSPKSNPDNKSHELKSHHNKKNIRFNFQNQICYIGQTSPKSSPGQSPRGKSTHSILKHKGNSIFSHQK